MRSDPLSRPKLIIASDLISNEEAEKAGDDSEIVTDEMAVAGPSM